MTEIGVTRGRGKGGATTTTALILPLLLLLLPLCPRRKLRRSTEAAISDGKIYQVIKRTAVHVTDLRSVLA